jgi:hypothetical protein
MSSKTSIAFSSIAIAVVVLLFVSGPIIGNHQALAQVPANQVSGVFGPFVVTCPNGSTLSASFGSGSFNAANDQNGQLIRGGFLLSAASGIIKGGTFTSATITSNSFTLTGTVNADTLCGTASGAFVILTGPCFAPPGAVGTFRLTGSDNEHAAISASIQCVTTPHLTELFKNQGECIDFANHNPDNTLGVTKQACMDAFQNKFTHIPEPAQPSTIG